MVVKKLEKNRAKNEIKHIRIVVNSSQLNLKWIKLNFILNNGKTL